MLSIATSMLLRELTNIVSSRNVDNVLALNTTSRVPNIGQSFYAQQDALIQNSSDVTPQRKETVLNTLTENSDIFEAAALLSERDWRYLSSKGALPGTMLMPEFITLPDSTATWGNGRPILQTVYNEVISMIQNEPHTVDPSVFNEYSTRRGNPAVNGQSFGGSDVYQWFKIPWGEITLYSSITGMTMDFPVYPEEISDGRAAVYDTMPELLYQYEPWYLYRSSGPRTNTYTFKFHRDMWTGRHDDGMANQLIRFCESQTFARYRGASVDTPIVTLYIAGKPVITGIVNEVKTDWSGPLGRLDNWYLMCELAVTITEISPETLDHFSVMRKPLGG